MIVVTAASGNLGRAIVANLLERVDAASIGVSLRDPSKMEDVRAAGVRVRRGDYEDIDTMVSSLDGAETVMFISSMGSDDARRRQHENVVEAASRCNVGRVVYTSVVEPVPENPFPPAAVHRETEKRIRESGVDYTILRNNFYADNILHEIDAIKMAGALRWPTTDGKTAYVARDDVATAAAHVLTSDGHSEQTYNLTGVAALDNAAVAAALSEVLGRPIPLEVVDRETYVQDMINLGYPAEMAAGALLSFDAVAEGFFERVHPECTSFIGRDPMTMTDVLRKYAL